jgi:hypothetical protein
MKSLPSNALSRVFTRREGIYADSVNLTNLGILYIAASFMQLLWVYVVVSNWGIAMKWVSIPLIGWALAAIWIAMTWCIVHLFVIGVRMIQFSRESGTVITQTPADRKRMLTLVCLLMLGILVDLVAIPLLLQIDDKSAILFFSGLIGGRILQANMEGILQYHRL